MKVYRRVGTEMAYPKCFRCNMPVNTDKPGYMVCRGNYQHLECVPMFVDITIRCGDFGLILYTTQSIREIINPVIYTTWQQWYAAKYKNSQRYCDAWPRLPHIDFIINIENIGDNDVLCDTRIMDTMSSRSQVLYLEDGATKLQFGGFLRGCTLNSLSFVVTDISDPATIKRTGFEIHGSNIIAWSRENG